MTRVPANGHKGLIEAITHCVIDAPLVHVIVISADGELLPVDGRHRDVNPVHADSANRFAEQVRRQAAPYVALAADIARELHTQRQRHQRYGRAAHTHPVHIR